MERTNHLLAHSMVAADYALLAVAGLWSDMDDEERAAFVDYQERRGGMQQPRTFLQRLLIGSGEFDPDQTGIDPAVLPNAAGPRSEW